MSRIVRAHRLVRHINAGALKITKADQLRDLPPPDSLDFGKTFTDHMLTVDWTLENGWEAPQIMPYGDLSLSPACPGLHYGIQCFEGMKAYKTTKGDLRLFRPDMNMKRMLNSMERLAMPAFEPDQLISLIKTLLRLDERWIPQRDGYSVYIRPAAIGTARSLGVTASNAVKLFVILSPVGPYYKTGLQPVRLLADTNNVRAWPGGTGSAKVSHSLSFPFFFRTPSSPPLFSSSLLSSPLGACVSAATRSPTNQD
jgi:branched-chain amino acid aminotransferase